jgi:N-terminal domain on NACHT_NTPase and P-loop NTPases
MDGLSAAASGMAVVSLAIQLVDSVRQIRRFFRTLKDAPEELDRLIDLLEHMEVMLANIGTLVDPDSDISPSVMKSLDTCEKALKKLDALIQKAKLSSSAQSSLKRSLGFFRFACKKQDVEEIEKQLDRAVNNLNMVMTYVHRNARNLTVLKLTRALNLHGIQRLWSGISATNAATSTITEVVLRMEVATNQKSPKQELPIENWSGASRSAVSRRSAAHRVVYRGFLGSITARIRSQSEDLAEGEQAKESYTQDEWSWVFIPSFLSSCLQVRCMSSFGSVERALRTYPILPDDHPAWRLCKDGEVTSMQKLFSTLEVSPYSVSRTGSTFLHVSREIHDKICQSNRSKRKPLLGIDPKYVTFSSNWVLKLM